MALNQGAVNTKYLRICRSMAFPLHWENDFHSVDRQQRTDNKLLQFGSPKRITKLVDVKKYTIVMIRYVS